MIFSWTYLLLLQAIVILTYYFKGRDRENHPFSKLFPTKVHFVIGNLSIFLACYLYNTERQLFCNPVPWTTVLLILFIASFLSYPFLRDRRVLSSLMAFFGGLGVFISVYITLFASWEYLVFLAFNIPVILIFHFTVRFLKRRFSSNVFDALYFYPAVILTPFFLLYQLLLVFKSLTKSQKRVFGLAPALTLITMMFFSLRVSQLVDVIRNSPDESTELQKLAESPIDRYLIELILGAHWKYHTELCLYDGWRPPFHDPVLVSVNKILSPFSKFDQGRPLLEANELYKVIYPENRTTFDCRCAKNERLFDDN